MGPTGLRTVAELSTYRAHYLHNRIGAIDGFTTPFTGPFFNEFVVKSQKCPVAINEELLEAGIIGGKPLDADYPELAGHSLWAVTEMRTREQLDTLVRELEVLA
ncbi:MAG: putative glycine dehydrogenase (decarboxylating) subunit 1 [Firmicutes bacterium ADurb.Bin506]|nr:MAG: putative glycine dehydrogenase (decarboxylating) subunit 1 [Firmicutes bacterium ADurb.Bin506]